MSPRWAWPTQHAPLDSSSCLSLLLIFLHFSSQGFVHPAPFRHASSSLSCPSAYYQLSLANVSSIGGEWGSCLSSPFLCMCPSLGFHPLSPGLVKDTLNGFIGRQPFLPMLPMPLPVTSHSSCCLATLTHPLRLCSGILSGTLPSPRTYPQESFPVSLVTPCLSVITCKME